MDELLTLHCVINDEDSLMIKDNTQGRLEIIITQSGNIAAVVLDSNQLKDIANLINLKVGK